MNRSIDPGKVTESRGFNLQTWLSQHTPVLSFIGVLLTLATFFWAIHSELSNFSSRLGNVEGKTAIMENQINDKPVIIYITPTPQNLNSPLHP